MSRLSVIRFKLYRAIQPPSLAIRSLLEAGWTINSQEVSYAIHEDWKDNSELEKVLLEIDMASRVGLQISFELRWKHDVDIYICMTQINPLSWSIRADGIFRRIANLDLCDVSWYLEKIIPPFLALTNTQNLAEITWNED